MKYLRKSIIILWVVLLFSASVVFADDVWENRGSFTWGVAFLHLGNDDSMQIIPITFGLRLMNIEHALHFSSQIELDWISPLYGGLGSSFFDYLSGRVLLSIILNESVKWSRVSDLISSEEIEYNQVLKTYLRHNVPVTDQFTLNFGYLNDRGLNTNRVQSNHNYLSLGLAYGTIRLDTFVYMGNFNISYVTGLGEEGMFKENGVLVEWITPMADIVGGSDVMEISLELMYTTGLEVTSFTNTGEIRDKSFTDKLHLALMVRGVY